MEQEMVDKIIHSLSKYAMNDIKNNREQPIAVFILGTCLINALSEYRYNSFDGFIEFMIEYLPMYKPIQFRDTFKKRLLRYYSLKGGYYIIGWGEKTKEENLQENTIHVDDFILNLDNALNKFIEDMQANKFDVTNIFDKHPTIQ